MDGPATSMEPFSLPLGLLAKILQLVPVKQRFAKCALVSHSWHAAALAATTSISMQLEGRFLLAPDVFTTALSRWLRQHSSALQNLCIETFVSSESWPECSLQLSFYQLRRLQSLKLHAIGVSESSDNEQKLSNWSYLTGLTHLQLQYVCFPTWMHLAQLSTLRNLRQLHIGFLRTEERAGGLNECMKSALLQLTQLSTLRLLAPMPGGVRFDPQRHGLYCEWRELGDVALAALDCHQQLLELELSGGLSITAAGLVHLPLNLTSLMLGNIISFVLCPHTTPRISELTRLQTLVIGEMFVDPNIVSCLVRLTRLDFDHTRLVATIGSSCTSNLLSVLPQLTNIQHLCLRGSVVDAAPNLEQYSALLSNTALTHLDLRDCRIPPSSFQYMFGANTQLPNLKILNLWQERPSDDRLITSHDDLQCLVSCCPSLKQLKVVNALDNMRIAALQQLAQLTHLAIGGIKAGGHALEDLQQLTALQNLWLQGVKEISTYQLLGMQRRLTQLTSLAVIDCNLSLPDVIFPACKGSPAWDCYMGNFLQEVGKVSVEESHAGTQQTIESAERSLREERQRVQELLRELKEVKGRVAELEDSKPTTHVGDNLFKACSIQ